MDKKTFITKAFRPAIASGHLDSNHRPRVQLESIEADWSLYPVESVQALCFGPREDKVLVHLEHMLDASGNMCFLYYEDLFLRWTYRIYDDNVEIIYQRNAEETYRLEPHWVYMRGCMLDEGTRPFEEVSAFHHTMMLWNGKMLCPLEGQLSNESKLFQLNNSIRQALSHVSTEDIHIPTSHVIKGYDYHGLLNKDKEYIVKSLSGVRSIVVDSETYTAWDLEGVVHLPVLFQEKIPGNDIRIHVLDTQLYGKKFGNKTSVDYRYDAHFAFNEDIQVHSEVLHTFCRYVCAYEHNMLMGLDFIHEADQYHILEANPNPGWSAYYPYDGIDMSNFLAHIRDLFQNHR